MTINYPYHSQSTKWMPWASGRPWNGIADVIEINTVWLVDTYRILFTNGTYTDFDITNWTNGTNGTNGADWVGSWDVVWPASSVNNNVALFNWTTGKLIKDSWLALSGSNTGDNAVNSLYSGLVSNATHTGDVTGATALTIANDAVTNAKMSNMATKTYKGRTSAATGDPEDVSVATLKADLVLVKGDVWLGNVDNTSDATKNSATATLTNKRVTKRVETVASSATPASNTDSYDITKITGLAVAITSLTSGLTGTPVDGDMHLWSITDNGTARALTLGASFEASTVALPTTTVISTRLDMLCVWNTATSKWRVVAVA